MGYRVRNLRNGKEADDAELLYCKASGEQKAEFFNSIPFTPKSKQNMTALMVARNDGENYGQLVLYQFPKSRTIYGPEQIEAQIDQNTEISKEFSLWSSAGQNTEEETCLSFRLTLPSSM